MSEYQYYEFLAVDRPLTKQEMAELREVSSRGEISSTSYVNEYHYGDFKGDPDEWMRLYFDAFAYYANWGTKTLKLKLPESLLPTEVVSPFAGETLWANSTHGFTVLTFYLQPNDPPDEWHDYSGDLGLLAEVRSELARGDFRSLYLGWLIDREGDYYIEDDEGGQSDEGDADDTEPPVPAGLKELTGSQQCLVEFFDIDTDLLAAAAVTSPPLVPFISDPDDLSRWIAHLPEAEKDAYLFRVLKGSGPAVGLEMLARFEKGMAPTGVVLDPSKRRSRRQLQSLGNAHRKARVKAEKARDAELKKRRLDDLEMRLPDVWARVERHMESKKANEYDQAARLLREIKELADRGGVPDFAARMGEIRARHSTKSALLKRLQSL